LDSFKIDEGAVVRQVTGFSQDLVGSKTKRERERMTVEGEL